MSENEGPNALAERIAEAIYPGPASGAHRTLVAGEILPILRAALAPLQERAEKAEEARRIAEDDKGRSGTALPAGAEKRIADYERDRVQDAALVEKAHNDARAAEERAALAAGLHQIAFDRIAVLAAKLAAAEARASRMKATADNMLAALTDEKERATKAEGERDEAQRRLTYAEGAPRRSIVATLAMLDERDTARAELSAAQERIATLEGERAHAEDKLCAYQCGPCREERGPWHQRGCPSWRDEVAPPPVPDPEVALKAMTEVAEPPTKGPRRTPEEHHPLCRHKDHDHYPANCTMLLRERIPTRAETDNPPAEPVKAAARPRCKTVFPVGCFGSDHCVKPAGHSGDHAGYEWPE